MSEIYSYCNEETTHVIEEERSPIFPDCDTMILPCRIGIYEAPDDEEIDVAPVGERIGNIEGWLVLGRDIERTVPENVEDTDAFMNLLCDDLTVDLGFVVSALLKEDGPLSLEHTIFGFNHFYLDEISITRPELLPRLLEELPQIIFKHMHVFPDIISYYPRPLPHEQEPPTALEDFAEQTKSAIMIQMMLGEIDVASLTPEQIDLLRDVQNSGTSYDEQYVDHALWEPFLDAGFDEWLDTRVLYMICDR